MTVIRVPVRELETLYAELRRFTGILTDLETNWTRGTLGKLEVNLTSEDLKLLVARARAEIGTLADGSRTLAQGIRDVADLMHEMDRRNAAAFPSMPRLSFSLPPISPPSITEPNASLPVISSVDQSVKEAGEVSAEGDQSNPAVRAAGDTARRSFTA
jgi:hypothetical protein